MPEYLQSYKTRILDFYQRNEVLVSVSVFVAGFVFDLLTLGRIDDLLNLVQQAIYIIILGSVLICEIKIKLGVMTLSEKGKRFWEYHDLVVHFLFGSLLSAYTIFYYTSASALTSFMFISLLAGLMLANEFPRFQKFGLPVRVILFSICILSYFAFFYPILMGHVGPIPFWLGFLTSMVFFYIVWKLQLEKFKGPELLKKHVIIPALSVHLVFLLGYYTSLIPPVPVAVKKIGVYYSLEKVNGDYIGTYDHPVWKFWSKGSQDFKARPGDKVTIILSIFSPARFNDQVFLKWYHDSEKAGWTLHDNIPMTIMGGRDEGFRGFGTKANFEDGNWRVVVETSDQREVGRINFTISRDDTVEPRTFRQDIF